MRMPYTRDESLSSMMRLLMMRLRIRFSKLQNKPPEVIMERERMFVTDVRQLIESNERLNFVYCQS